MSIRIALAEDHPVLWAGLRDLLASEAGASVVGDAGTGEAALALVTRGRPGVLLLDLRLPDAAGLNLIEPALAAVPDLRVIVFWSRATGEDLRRAFQTGAAGFLAKDTDGEAVIGAVRTVARGGRALSGRRCRVASWTRSPVRGRRRRNSTCCARWHGADRTGRSRGRSGSARRPSGST